MSFHIKTDRINVYAASRSGSSSLKKYFDKPYIDDTYTIENWYSNAERNIPNLIFIRHPYTRLKSAIKLKSTPAARVFDERNLTYHFWIEHGGPYLYTLMEMKQNRFSFRIAMTEDINDYIGMSAGPRQYVTDTTLDGIDWTALPFTKQSIIQEYDTYLELLKTIPKMTSERFKELTHGQ